MSALHITVLEQLTGIVIVASIESQDLHINSSLELTVLELMQLFN